MKCFFFLSSLFFSLYFDNKGMYMNFVFPKSHYNFICLFPFVFCGNYIIALGNFILIKKMYFLALKATKFLQDGDPKCDLASADGDSGAVWMKMDYSLEPITPTNLSSSSPERREGDSRRETERERQTEISGLWRRWRWWWRKKEKRSHRVRQSAFILTWASRCTSSHPWQTSTAKHQREKGQPEAMGSHHGAKLSSIPLYTHTYTHYSHSHSTCPLDLTIKTQEQISRLVTAAQKQMTPNTWLLYGLFCGQAREGCSRQI